MKKDMWNRDVAALTFASLMALIPFMELESCAVGWDDIERILACSIKEGQKIELAKL